MKKFLLFLALILIKSVYNERKQADVLPQIIIHKAFYYPSSTFTLFTARTQNTIVLLLYTRNIIRMHQIKPLCVIKMNGKNKKRLKARMEPICPQQMETDYVRGKSEPKMIAYQLICSMEQIFPKYSIRLNKGPLIKPITRRVDPFQRELVVCAGTMADAMQILQFVTAMEIFRYHRVDLVIIHVNSVETHLLKLLRAYIGEGLVELRPSFMAPFPIEQQWDTQQINQNECLYEFKANTQFILLSDWNELVVSQKPLLSIVTSEEIVWQLHHENKSIDHISMAKRHIEMVKPSNPGDFVQLWQNGYIYVDYHAKKQLNFTNHSNNNKILVPNYVSCSFMQKMANGIILSSELATSLSITSQLNTIAKKSNFVNLHYLEPEFIQFLTIEPQIKVAMSEYFDKQNGKQYVEIRNVTWNSTTTRCYKSVSKWITFTNKRYEVFLLDSEEIDTKRQYFCNTLPD